MNQNRLVLGCLLILLLLATAPLWAQTELDVEVAVGDSISRFWLQIPAGYDSTHPPALLVFWHQWGGDEHELRDFTDFENEANTRGWLVASHLGWSEWHWNNPLAQEYARAMMVWIRDNFPFDEDSIYHIGGSMGGAAGMIYHNNHCDSRDDFFTAATASGSGIMDCYRRAMEYLAQGDTNRTMRLVFGGLPEEAPFEYQRNSAIHFADTTYSMHFNSRHLPVLLTFGLDEGVWKSHALDMDSVRQGWADTTFTYENTIPGHGIGIMWPPAICDWLSGFRANRYPDELSINADEDGRYYWVSCQSAFPDTTFTRFEARKNVEENRVDLAAIRHVARLTVDGAEIGLDLQEVITGSWRNLEAGQMMDVTLLGLEDEPDSVTLEGNIFTNWDYDSIEQKLVVTIGGGGLFRIYPYRSSARHFLQPLPTEIKLSGNWPNPFNSTTSFLLEQTHAGQVDFAVYNVLGQKIWQWSSWIVPGVHRLTFDAAELPSGIYFYRLESPIQSPINRMVLIR